MLMGRSIHGYSCNTASSSSSVALGGGSGRSSFVILFFISVSIIWCSYSEQPEDMEHIQVQSHLLLPILYDFSSTQLPCAIEPADHSSAPLPGGHELRSECIVQLASLHPREVLSLIDVEPHVNFFWPV